MTDHAPLPVSGYTAQPQSKIDEVNINKKLEETVLRRLDLLKAKANAAGLPLVDQRWLTHGRTLIEDGFMAVNRSIFQPERVKLEGDQ